MRAFLVWILPAAAAFAAWWIFLGTDSDDQYTVGQVAGLVVVLLVIAVAAGWLARTMDLLPLVVSAVVGISAGCWSSWSDDDSGMFAIGWLMVTAGAAIAATVVIVGSWAVRRRVDVKGRPAA
ncbi:hypothetical protein H9L21_08590 [Aeromicrobium senzhongii]|uniref:Uncharacterized protein n=1 Tax=Aeromicrobium senzhongii TaxID=2663859 RepID=A0A8I0JZ54_9ACTN|nr:MULTISPECIES: hypothetical protein [Aeromicrobium]MBC9224931.1 hypothetical protein [Aeromicrobium senzhongii]QNL93196.1 hypothetical protein H9L21_08590 [Aeromicrobium senzhongii]